MSIIEQTEIVLFLLLILAAPPVVWLIAEFRGSRRLRIASGIIAMAILALVPSSVAFFGAYTSDFSANHYYNMTTNFLVKRTLEALEAGHYEQLHEAFLRFDDDFYPAYEHRANYAELTEEFIARLDGPDEE